MKSVRSLVDVIRYSSLLVGVAMSDSASLDPECERDIATAAAALKQAIARVGRRDDDHVDLTMVAPMPERRPLTPRERQIVRLLVQGMSYKEIASALGIAFSTAQSRVKSIYAKLGVHSKSELQRSIPATVLQATGPA